MKELETLLRQHAPTPKRQLHATFTKEILMKIDQQPEPNVWQKVREHLPARLFGRAGAISFASLLLVSGSVAAIALWPKPTVTRTDTTTLPSGNRIVGYDAANCNYFKNLDGSELKPTSEKLYYELRQGSPLTDQQLQDALRAVCEENISNNAISAIFNQLPKDLPGLQSTQAYTINAITKNSITLSPDPHYNPALSTSKPHLKYTHFAADLQTYNQGNKAAYGDFRAGDTIKMIVHDASGKSSETPEDYKALNHPEAITILALIKIPPLTADPNVFYAAVGSDLVRLEPCTTNPTGLCRAYEFAR